MLQKDTPFEWGPDQDKALQKPKDALLSDVVLMLTDLNERFYIQSDASKVSCAQSFTDERRSIETRGVWRSQFQTL
jgi:hypothetical protein